MSRSLRSIDTAQRTSVASARIQKNMGGIGTLAAFGMLKMTPPKQGKVREREDGRKRETPTATSSITIMPWGILIQGREGRWENVECCPALKASGQVRMGEKWLEMAGKPLTGQRQRKLASYVALEDLYRRAMQELAA